MIYKNQVRKVVLRPVLLFAIACVLLNNKSLAQDNAPVKFGKVSIQDFTLKSSAIDSNSSAVIIMDKGDISFEGNEQGWFNYVFKRIKRIMIIKNKGFDLATVRLLLYKNEDAKEEVDNLVGITYNVENGQVIETKLNSKDVFDEKFDRNHFYKKFTMPSVKEGSIIEYSYTIKSGFTFNLPSWEFQSEECPTLWSEYNVAIPGLLNYMSIFQGTHKFDINKKGEGFKSYSVARTNREGGAYSTGTEQKLTVSSPTTLHRWVMKDVPAFYAENYISSPANYVDKISFQLYMTYDGENYHDVANSWKKLSEELMKREDFGKPASDDNDWLDKVMASIINENDNSLQTAKRIYYYIQNNYTCTDHHDKYINTSLQDVVKKKSGTVGDINLLLIAMLNHKNIRALPVLLSTTEHGRSNHSYPVLQQLNYVIAKINLASVDYYLDASIPFLPFGKLPSNCYNGYAGVISNDSTGIYFEPDSLRETRSVSVFIANSDNKKVEGTFTHNMGFFESLDTKGAVAKSSLHAYETKLKTSFPEDMSLSNIEIDSLRLPEDPVSIKFDFALPAFENADIVYFNPLIGESLKENPFYQAERAYPVEMPYTTDNIYNLSMEIPAGYKVDELPKSARVMLNNTDGAFEYLVSADATLVQMRCRLTIKKANFTSEDYHTLRDFYGFIVKKEAEQIVFKKIK